MKNTDMYKYIASTLALVACAALPALAAEPVAKEKGSRAKELQAMKAEVRPVKPITKGGIKAPDAPPPRANASTGQPSSATGAVAEPGASK